jgi:hypothetical protein
LNNLLEKNQYEVEKLLDKVEGKLGKRKNVTDNPLRKP